MLIFAALKRSSASASEPSRGGFPASSSWRNMPVVVLVLRDVREVREVAEGADDRDRGLDVEGVELLGERRARRGVPVPAKAHRELPDVLDGLEDLRALVRADRVAEHPAEHPDVRAERALWSFGAAPSTALPFAGGPLRDALAYGLPVRAASSRWPCGFRATAPFLTASMTMVAPWTRRRPSRDRRSYPPVCGTAWPADIGTCTKRPCQRPISISVLPAIAACTALRAMFQQ